MEVFLRNVPQELTDHTLASELEPFMKALGIDDWDCDKPARKKLAWVWFLNQADGHKFLKKHQKVQVDEGLSQTLRYPNTSPNAKFKEASRVPNTNQNGKAPKHFHARPPDIAKLHITNTPIYVEKSRRALNKHTIGHLKHQKDERVRASTRNQSAPALSIGIGQIACGHNVFANPDDRLTFVQQTSLTIHGTAKLNQQSLSVVISGLWRMDVPHETIEDFIAGHNDHTLTLVLSEPPRIYAMINRKIEALVKWERRSSCPHWPGHSKYAGRCLVYQLTTLTADFGDMVRSIKARDLISVTQDTLPVDRTPQPFFYDYSTSMSEFEGRINDNASSPKQLHFMLVFQVQALVWNDYLHPSQGTHMLQLMENLMYEARKLKKPPPLTVDSMKRLFQQIPYRLPGTEPRDVDVVKLLRRMIEIEANLRRDDPFRQDVYGAVIPNHQAWVMKAMITPTRIILHGPEAESKNRILRKFHDRTDYFIRCQFCDDDGQDLSFNPKISNEPVYERYRQVLKEGLQVAGRRFSFLGFSHSSLRSHSAWFMASFTDSNMERQHYETIIKSLGKFDDIKVPARCAARIGQAFSETPYAVPVFDLGIQSRYIPDVKNHDSSRIFSDGVGTVSHSVMHDFWRYLPESSAAATCFQIRWGGVKGLLSLDSRLKGKEIRIRKESMLKFQSDDMMELGICDTASKPFRMMLNRQMIKILEDMGTPDKWFFKLQARELRLLQGVTAQVANTSKFLGYQLVGNNMGLPQFIRQIDRMGIDYRRDRFLKTVVEHVVLRELRLLKHKARIPVPKGVTLFGIMDETDYLKENEVFVTFDKTLSLVDRPPNQGLALITRSPALHPGDIRTVNLVTPPPDSPLKHLRNCVVFSQRGTRDLPSQLSGGDLDGDLYNIIWDSEAMPQHEFDPADYPRVSPKPLDREVNREDIADFFINFMKTDILGMIAIRHQIIADVSEGGTRDPACIMLAEMHSTAVDSSKTGIPVEIKALPKAPRTRPDFLAPAPPLKIYDTGQIAHIGEDEAAQDNDDDMGGTRHRYHQSDKILGRLYRSIDEKNIWSKEISRPTLKGGPSIWTQVLEIVNQQIRRLGRDVQHTRQLKEAWKIRNYYDSAVAEMMWRFSDNPRTPISEVEVFCGSILNKRGSQTRRQRDSSIKLRDEIERVTTWIVDMIRDRGETYSRDEIVELCLACVHVGCVKDPSQYPDYHEAGDLQSFRVLAACCLLREVNSLSRVTRDDAGGGGYVGVGGGQQRQMTLALR